MVVRNARSVQEFLTPLIKTFYHLPSSHMRKNVSFAGSLKSARLALAFALLFAVGSFSFYACTNKNAETAPQPSKQNTVRQNKSTSIPSGFVSIQLPGDLTSSTGIEDENETHDFQYQYQGATRTGRIFVSLDQAGKHVKFALNQSLVNDLGGVTIIEGNLGVMGGEAELKLCVDYAVKKYKGRVRVAAIVVCWAIYIASQF